METTILDPKAIVEHLEATFIGHIRDRDAASLAVDFYAADAQLHAPNAPPALGRPAVARTLQALLDNGLCHMELKSIDVHSAGKTIWSRGEYVSIIETPQGTINDKGTYVTIFEPQDDGYRCVVDIFNSDLPPNITPSP